MFTFKRDRLPTADQALKGREEPITISGQHYVLDSQMTTPYPEGTETIVFGLGCFWGAEKAFWQLDGVYTTAVGYAAGITPNPSYQEVCSGDTGHNEVVLVVYWPEQVSLEVLIKQFWESHNPTQGMRQGNDQGTQYRSGIYFTTSMQKDYAEASKTAYEQQLKAQLGDKVSITTEVLPAPTFYFAEEYHQQYLAKNPNGYCGLGGLGIPLNE